MTLAAGPWYTSATFSTILSAAGVLAAVVIGVLGFWLLRLPLRRLLVFSMDASSLIADPSGALRNSQLQVIYAGQPVPTPNLVTFSLTSKSRTDIRRDDFDGGQPLVFDFGTSVALLASTAPGDADDWFSVDGSRILVGPRLIRRGQLIHLSLLANEPVQLEYQNSLAGVTLQEKRETDARRRTVATTMPVIAALRLPGWSGTHWPVRAIPAAAPGSSWLTGKSPRRSLRRAGRRWSCGRPCGQTDPMIRSASSCVPKMAAARCDGVC
jgi:hypothetical protein